MTPSRPLRLVLAAFVAALTVLAACTTAASPTPIPTPTPTEEPTPTAAPIPTPRPTPTPTPTPVPTPTPIPIDEAMLERRVTVLIAGTDSSRIRRQQGAEINTDAMVVASVDAAHSQVQMVALPRDTVDLILADGTVWPQKANGIMRHLGLDALKGALATTYGVPIDYYVAIDMNDFAHLVDSVGGIDVELAGPLYDPVVGLNLGAGVHHFDGATALMYVRSRYQDGDYGRAARQQQVIAAIARKLVAPDTNVDPVEFIQGLGTLQTDIPADKFPTLLEIGRRSADASVGTMVLGPPRFALYTGIDGARGWVMIPNIAEMRAYVQAVMAP